MATLKFKASFVQENPDMFGSPEEHNPLRLYPNDTYTLIMTLENGNILVKNNRNSSAIDACKEEDFEIV